MLSYLIMKNLFLLNPSYRYIIFKTSIYLSLPSIVSILFIISQFIISQFRCCSSSIPVVPISFRDCTVSALPRHTLAPPLLAPHSAHHSDMNIADDTDFLQSQHSIVSSLSSMQFSHSRQLRSCSILIGHVLTPPFAGPYHRVTGGPLIART